MGNTDDTCAYREVTSPDESRRVHAALSCEEGLELFLQNRGRVVEELHVDFREDVTSGVACLGAHALQPGKFVVLELERLKPFQPALVSIVGGPEPITLTVPATRTKRRIFDQRAGIAAIGIFAIVVLIASFVHLPAKKSPNVPVPVPAAVDNLSTVDTGALRVPTSPLPLRRDAAGQPATLAPFAPRPQPAKPPTISVSTAAQAFRGDRIRVAFHSNAASVHVVAQIGPKKIDDLMLARGNGSVLLRGVPPSSRLRVLTVTVSALRGGASSTRRALVVLLPDDRDLSSYAVSRLR